MIIEEPAASVRLLLPAPGAELVIPEWKGNEFLLPDGRRPVIRTFTPRRFDATALELDIDAVIHGAGPASSWAATVAAGAAAALSGPGRGYTIDPDATAFLLAGDETAIPAISQLLESITESVAVQVHIEVGAPDGRLALPAHHARRCSGTTFPPARRQVTRSSPGCASPRSHRTSACGWRAKRRRCNAFAAISSTNSRCPVRKRPCGAIGNTAAPAPATSDAAEYGVSR